MIEAATPDNIQGTEYVLLVTDDLSDCLKEGCEFTQHIVKTARDLYDRPLLSEDDLVMRVSTKKPFNPDNPVTLIYLKKRGSKIDFGTIPPATKRLWEKRSAE